MGWSCIHVQCIECDPPPPPIKIKWMELNPRVVAFDHKQKKLCYFYFLFVVSLENFHVAVFNCQLLWTCTEVHVLFHRHFKLNTKFYYKKVQLHGHSNIKCFMTILTTFHSTEPHVTSCWPYWRCLFVSKVWEKEGIFTQWQIIFFSTKYWIICYNILKAPIMNQKQSHILV